MSNRHYLKKKPQNKSYSPSTSCGNYLSQDEPGNIESTSLGPIYEQIKSEVVSSVLNWLSMYMAADQEDKKINEQTGDPNHCCECTINKRLEKSNRSSTNSSFSSRFSKNSLDLKHSTLDNHPVRFEDAATSTEDDNIYFKDDLLSDIPEDSNLISTDFRAGQVWPDWCNYIEKSFGKLSTGDLGNSQVYYDKFNDRLCVYRRGLVEYPQLNKKSPRIDNSNVNYKQNLQSIPEVRESILKANSNLIDQNNKIECDRAAKESLKCLINPESILKQQFDNFNLDVNLKFEDSDYDCHSTNIVKCMSLPNFQFQE